MNYPAWLEDAVIYNIYPQSFKDSNGDGIGDLPGIISKLDYIQSLGVNVIWLNPIYVSPFKDAGYDVVDYCRVAPRYGTNDDLKELVNQAHSRKLKLVLDFVPGHTSDEHPWFKQSALVEKNQYSNRYIWTEGTFANNESTYIYGMHARDGGYCKNFFNFQPALNYGYYNVERPWQLPIGHPDVLETVEDMNRIMRFWLDMGVDGFRVDMAASLIKNDPYGCGIREYWQKVRSWWDKDYPDRVLISEWSVPRDAVDAGFHVDFMIHIGTGTYNNLFRMENDSFICQLNGKSYFRAAGKGDAKCFINDYLDQLRCIDGKGFISVPTGNHDFPRISMFRSNEEMKVAYTFLFTLAGIPALYYGDEIGMRNISGLSSKEGGYARTVARTPMQWDNCKNAGFSDAPAEKLYLPVDNQNNAPNVAEQQGKEGSLLEFTRELIALRRKHPELNGTGEIEFIYAEKNAYPLVYIRRKGEKCSMVVLNASNKTIDLRLNDVFEYKSVLLNSGIVLKKQNLHVPPLSYAIFNNSEPN